MQHPFRIFNSCRNGQNWDILQIFTKYVQPLQLTMNKVTTLRAMRFIFTSPRTQPTVLLPHKQGPIEYSHRYCRILQRTLCPPTTEAVTKQI